MIFLIGYFNINLDIANMIEETLDNLETLNNDVNRKIQLIRHLDDIYWSNKSILDLWQKMFLTKISVQEILSTPRTLLEEEYEDIVKYQKMNYGIYQEKIMVFSQIKESLGKSSIGLKEELGKIKIVEKAKPEMNSEIKSRLRTKTAKFHGFDIEEENGELFAGPKKRNKRRSKRKSKKQEKLLEVGKESLEGSREKGCQQTYNGKEYIVLD